MYRSTSAAEMMRRAHSPLLHLTTMTPLARYRVLILRSPQQASALAERIRSLGADPIILPTIETADPDSFVALDEAIAELSTFDWLLFTSANAVERFAQRLQRLQGQPHAECVAGLLAGACAGKVPRFAAIGPATADALVNSGLAASRTEVLMPQQFVAESLMVALLPHAVRPGGKSTHFLLVRAEEARELLPETLRAAGASVVVASAYRTVVPESSVVALGKLFSVPEDAPDAITFTSSSSARNLLSLCGAAGVKIPSDTLLISIGPITSQTLRELGLPPHAEAREATVQSLADATLDALRAQRP